MLLVRPGRALVRKGVTLESDIVSDVPATVFGDPTRLRQILSNLVSSTSSGSIRFA
jgi:signal transduction histidine kinase